jgi:hypothetical protein
MMVIMIIPVKDKEDIEKRCIRIFKSEYAVIKDNYWYFVAKIDDIECVFLKLKYQNNLFFQDYTEEKFQQTFSGWKIYDTI